MRMNRYGSGASSGDGTVIPGEYQGRAGAGSRPWGWALGAQGCYTLNVIDAVRTCRLVECIEHKTEKVMNFVHER